MAATTKLDELLAVFLAELDEDLHPEFVKGTLTRHPELLNMTTAAPFKMTLLHAAAGRRSDTLHMLLTMGADPNLTEPGGKIASSLCSDE